MPGCSSRRWRIGAILRTPKRARNPVEQPRKAPAAVREVGDPVFDRPVFIVSPPRTGSTFLFETLAQAPSVFTIGDESHQLIEGVPGLAPESRGFASNRLLAEDATPAIVSELRARFFAALTRSRPESADTGDARAHAREDAEECAAGAVPGGGVSRSPFPVSASRSAAGTVEHDRGVDVGTLPDLSEPAELDRTAVVAAARAGLAATRRATAASHRRGAMAHYDAVAARRSRAPAGRTLVRS